MDETHSANELLRKQAWDYFQMHSAQRLTTFNFYIVISSVMATALFATFQKDFRFPRLGMLIGFLLTLFSFVFRKLDRRNSDLIKGAESALRFFEGTLRPEDDSGIPHISKIFSREDYETLQKKQNRSILFWKRHYSYSDCFKAVFLAFGLVGFLGLILAYFSN